MPIDDTRFIQLAAMFQMAALQQMGKLVNPVSGEVEKDLQQAKNSIDLIEMLAEKTKGNLTPDEAEFLDKILFELRMNYVDEVRRSEKEAEKDEEKEGGAGEQDSTPEDTADARDRDEEHGESPGEENAEKDD